MHEVNNPNWGTTSQENNMESHRGRNFTIPQPIAEEEQHQQQLESSAVETDNKTSPAAALIDSVKQFFAPCVGAVDAASLYIGECRPSSDLDPNDQGDNIAEDVIMRLRERNGGFRQHTVRRRSETLEIPTHGMLFDDDDVSAISSHTLEEMERLRLAQNSRLSSFQISPSSNYSSVESAASNILRPKLTVGGQKAEAWNIQKSLASNETPTDATDDISICVSASDSSSSQVIKDDKVHEQSAQPSWGNKADNDEGFKTHPVG